MSKILLKWVISWSRTVEFKVGLVVLEGRMLRNVGNYLALSLAFRSFILASRTLIGTTSDSNLLFPTWRCLVFLVGMSFTYQQSPTLLSCQSQSVYGGHVICGLLLSKECFFFKFYFPVSFRRWTEILNQASWILVQHSHCTYLSPCPQSNTGDTQGERFWNCWTMTHWTLTTWNGCDGLYNAKYRKLPRVPILVARTVPECIFNHGKLWHRWRCTPGAIPIL